MFRFNDEAANPAGPADPATSAGPSIPPLEIETVKGTPYSDAENTVLRAAFKSGDKDKVAAAHAQIAAARANPEAPKAPGPVAMVGDPTDPQLVQPPQQINPTTGEAEGAEALADFTAQTGGIVDGANLEAIGRHTEPWARQNDEIISRYPNDLDAGATALAEHWNKGEERVLRELYRGSEPAFAAGIKEIDAALDLLPNGHGAKLREALNEHRALADLKTHQHVLTLARLVTKKLGKK